MADKSVPRELGLSGLPHVAGRVVEDEQAAALRFPQSIKTYQRMKSDPIISGSLFMIKQFIRKVDWEIEPAGGLEATESAKTKADIVRDSLFIHMERSFDQLMSDICTFIENGFGFHEPTYKIMDGNVVWKDLPSRPPSSIKGFNFDAHGYVKSVEQWQTSNSNLDGTTTGSDYNMLSTSATKKIPYKRLLHFRTDSEKNNPLGRSVLKNAYKAYYFKTKLEEHEAIGVEREMNGLPSITAPIEYITADPVENPQEYAVYQDLIRLGTNARNNEQACVFLPSDTDENGNKYFTFDLISSQGTRSLDTSKIIERYDYRIAQSLLSDFLLMGSSNTGSFALSDNKVHTFVQSLEAYLEVISEQFNRKAIPDLYKLNNWDESELCKLKHKPIGSATLTELGQYLERVKNFVTPDKSLENALRQRADLPDRDDKELYIDTPTPTHQAHSQRIGMENSANNKSDSDPEETDDKEPVEESKDE